VSSPTCIATETNRSFLFEVFRVFCRMLSHSPSAGADGDTTEPNKLMSPTFTVALELCAKAELPAKVKAAAARRILNERVASILIS
jgi:hypothetical protein